MFQNVVLINTCHILFAVFQDFTKFYGLNPEQSYFIGGGGGGLKLDS